MGAKSYALHFAIIPWPACPEVSRGFTEINWLRSMHGSKLYNKRSKLCFPSDFGTLLAFD
jgi:hypothetical protein